MLLLLQRRMLKPLQRRCLQLRCLFVVWFLLLARCLPIPRLLGQGRVLPEWDLVVVLHQVLLPKWWRVTLCATVPARLDVVLVRRFRQWQCLPKVQCLGLLVQPVMLGSF